MERWPRGRAGLSWDYACGWLRFVCNRQIFQNKRRSCFNRIQTFCQKGIILVTYLGETTPFNVLDFYLVFYCILLTVCYVIYITQPIIMLNFNITKNAEKVSLQFSRTAPRNVCLTRNLHFSFLFGTTTTKRSIFPMKQDSVAPTCSPRQSGESNFKGRAGKILLMPFRSLSCPVPKQPTSSNETAPRSRRKSKNPEPDPPCPETIPLQRALPLGKRTSNNSSLSPPPKKP